MRNRAKDRSFALFLFAAGRKIMPYDEVGVSGDLGDPGEPEESPLACAMSQEESSKCV